MADPFYEKLYHNFPVFLQNIAVSVYGLKLRRQRYNKQFHSYLKDLCKTEWQSSEEIEAYQNDQVNALIKHAYNTVPFYKNLYDSHGINISQIQNLDDLNQLPIITKNEVKKAGAQLVSDEFQIKKLIKTKTSGTTGLPLTVYQTNESISRQWAFFWRSRTRFGLSINDSQLMFGARIPVSQKQHDPPYWRHDYFNNRVYLSTSHISKKTLKPIVDYLNSNRFVFYAGYPSAMYSLAKFINDFGIEVKKKPEVIAFGSDSVLPGQKKLIAKIFGAKIIEFYGMVEFAGTMSMCEHGRFHTDHEHCFIDTMETNEPGSSKLILTGWGNKAMPFIRYDIGDYAALSRDKCLCGRHTNSFLSIDGRIEDYITTPDGRKLRGFNQVFKNAKNILELQMIQEKIEEVTIRIVPDHNFIESDRVHLIKEFRKRAGHQLAVNFDIVEAIPRLKNGKFKAVISNVK